MFVRGDRALRTFDRLGWVRLGWSQTLYTIHLRSLLLSFYLLIFGKLISVLDYSYDMIVVQIVIASVLLHNFICIILYRVLQHDMHSFGRVSAEIRNRCSTR